MQTWGPLLAAHAVGATFAVAVGAAVVLRPRKGDRLHRLLGRLWVADMYSVCVSSFWVKRLIPGHFSPIHLLSVWTLVSLTAGLVAAIRGDVRRHRGFMVGSYLGLVGAGLAAAAVPERLIPQTLAHRPLTLAVAVAATLLAAAVAVGLTRLVVARDWSPRRSATTVSRHAKDSGRGVGVKAPSQTG